MATSAQLVGQPDLQNLAIRLAQQQAPNQLPPTGAVAAPINMGGGGDLGISIPHQPVVFGPHGQETGPVPPRGTLEGDKVERQRVLGSGAGVDQISSRIQDTGFGEAHPLASKIIGGLAQGVAKLGDVGLSAIAPALAINIPGTEYHHLALEHGLNKQIGAEEAEGQKEAQTGEEQAQTEHLSQEVAAGEPVEITPEQALSLSMPELAGQKVSPAVLARLSGQHQANTTKEGDVSKVVQGREDVANANNARREAVADKAEKGRESLAEAANKTRMLIAGMRDATSRANNENSVSHRGTTAAGGKVPADVTKRAALANNVLENSQAVDSLLSRNPSIVGAGGGRYSNVQDMIGSDDPDIAELGVRMHNIALASNGAHGIRSAEAIRQTEDELFKNFKRGPEGIHSALNATRGSMQTFLDDEKGFQTTGQRGGKLSSESKPAENDPLGIR